MVGAAVRCLARRMGRGISSISLVSKVLDLEQMVLVECMDGEVNRLGDKCSGLMWCR